MKVGEIVFDDGSIMKDRDIFFCGNFVIVDTGEGAPTMYNQSTILELRKVEEIRPQSRNVVW